MCEVEQEDAKGDVYTHKTFERDWTLKLEEIEAFEPLNVKQLALVLLDSLNLDAKMMPGCVLPLVKSLSVAWLDLHTCAHSSLPSPAGC